VGTKVDKFDFWIPKSGQNNAHDSMAPEFANYLRKLGKDQNLCFECKK